MNELHRKYRPEVTNKECELSYRIRRHVRVQSYHSGRQDAVCYGSQVGHGYSRHPMPNSYREWVGRFMESPLSLFRMHWDHEPVRIPLSRPSATLSPVSPAQSGGEGRERGRFMESLHSEWVAESQERVPFMRRRLGATDG